MITVFFKSIVIFVSVLFVLRIMGKRQLGEMQPFELVITFILAEVACIPINDPYIPLYFGIIPIISLGMLHILISVIVRKSMFVRRALSGRSVIVVDKNGINYESLKKMNLNMNDLVVAVRSSGYVDFNKIEYAIIETNGKLCVVEKTQDTTAEIQETAVLPISIFIDGYWDESNLSLSGVRRDDVIKAFTKNGYKKTKDILYADVRQDGTLYISPKSGKCFTDKVSLNGGGW